MSIPDACLTVFLDISQAFDTVWHNGLLQIFLSQPHPLLASVLQGLCWSPTLFNIMINDPFFTIIHLTRLQYNWHNDKNTDGLLNRLASNLVILNQAHRVAWLIGQEKILK